MEGKHVVSLRFNVDLASVFLLAVALSMDAAAVAVLRGLQTPRPGIWEALITALYFGIAQAVMPLLGWGASRVVGSWFLRVGSYVAFLVLLVLGIQMLRASRSNGPEGTPEEPSPHPPFGFRTLLPLAIATSLDAMAAGITLPLFRVPVVLSIALIFLVTAALSALGVLLGRRLGTAIGRRMDALGGAVLVLLSIKVLVGGLRS